MHAQSKSVQKQDCSHDLWHHITLPLSILLQLLSSPTIDGGLLLLQGTHPFLPHSQSPFQHKTQDCLPTQPSTTSQTQPTLQSNLVPVPSHSQGGSQPAHTLTSLPKAGSPKGAESGVSSRTMSYLGKTCSGKDRRLRTGCLGCKVCDKTCFFAV